MDETKLKFCINCKHYFDDCLGRYQYCNHPNNVDYSYNLVTGNRRIKIKFDMDTLRENNMDAFCGKAGDWVEQKYYGH